MRSIVVILVISSALVACVGGSEWVHPTKPKDLFLQDWNACENKMLRDPKLQQGNKFILNEATERCVMKAGWILKEKS